MNREPFLMGQHRGCGDGAGSQECAEAAAPHTCSSNECSCCVRWRSGFRSLSVSHNEMSRNAQDCGSHAALIMAWWLRLVGHMPKTKDSDTSFFHVYWV